ncbi:MAG: FAD-dependent oxidoreductase [Hyphomicrobiaceae bacterium]|nr:FAD-dependent oxidoreductase [Hyphomicrobiaceae bacterium]
MTKPAIIVAGAGVLGLWQALLLARAGHPVRLVERSAEPFAQAASFYAGAMLGPFCETEAQATEVREPGLAAIEMWRREVPATHVAGTLVVAPARDLTELDRFARLTEGHRAVDADAIRTLEPDLGDRFARGLFYPQEGHMAPVPAMRHLLQAARAAGCETAFGCAWHNDMAPPGTLVVDCRGMGARDDLKPLRGVRGERIVIRTREVSFSRPVRLLHPRHPLYVVPWDNGEFMVGATVIESEDDSPLTVRSGLELLSLAYALHPAFGEAEIVTAGAGVRPSWPDNYPKIIPAGRVVHVNGSYRHGFLLAPLLADLVVRHLADGSVDPLFFAQL